MDAVYINNFLCLRIFYLETSMRTTGLDNVVLILYKFCLDSFNLRSFMDYYVTSSRKTFYQIRLALNKKKKRSILLPLPQFNMPVYTDLEMWFVLHNPQNPTVYSS